MNLHELDALRPTQQIARTIENQLGKSIDFDRMDRRQARHMLSRVQDLLREHRQSTQRHVSERDPGYLNLMILERGLKARIREQDQPMAIDVNDPKTKQTLDKAARGQNLNPDEVKTVAAVATMKTMNKESRIDRRRRLREQSELQQAQVVLASQDMIDRIQGMLEDVSEMQFKDLPALTDSIKQDMGMDQASQFQAQATAALNTLLQALQAGKGEMESAQGVLTGQPMTVPGQGDAMAQPAMQLPPSSQMPAAEPAPEPAPEPVTDVAALGRERR